jgi:hypothetical protein
VKDGTVKGWMHSGRRAFLRGLGGAAVSLPLLEYTHGRAFAQDAAPKRFLTVFEHGGTISNMYRGWPHGDGGWRADGTEEGHGEDLWHPVGIGEALELGPIHQPLAPWTSKLMVLTGIDNRAGILQSGYGDGGHGTGNVTALTAADVEQVGSDVDDNTSLAASIDHVLAERLAALQPTRFNRIHLNVEGHQYGSPYFRAARERVYGEPDPRVAFESIFDGVTETGGPDPAFLHRQARRRSVLDGVLDGFERFRGRVSSSDLATIDAHLTHLRALEREIDSLDMPAMCMPPGASGGATADVIGPLHARIIVAALRCGLTNVANLEIADIITPWVGGTDWGYEIGHSLHHVARDLGPTGAMTSSYDQWFEEMLANRRWRMSLVAELLDGLDDPAFLEGGRTLLDNSLLLATSEFSNGSVHVAYNMPILLAGSAGGHFRTGRHLDFDHAPGAMEYASNESTHNLFTSILQAFGGEDDHFGSDHAVHRGPVPGLT